MNTNIKKEKPTYTESGEVAAARSALDAAESAKPSSYASNYGGKIADIADRILSGEKFSYDFNADPIYNVWREQTEINRRRAVADAAASAAALTGGYANSYGTTAATEASAKSYDSLRSLIPSLVEAAYKRWQDEKTQERATLDTLMKLDSTDYSRWRDSVSDYNTNRDYLYGKYSDVSAADYKRFEDALSQWNADRDYDRRAYEFEANDAYRRERDAAEDALRQREYELELYKANLAAASRTAAAEAKNSKESASDADDLEEVLNYIAKTKSEYAKGLYNAIVTGRAHGKDGLISKSFIEKVESAKSSSKISQEDYEKFMNYIYSVGISG